MQFIKFHKNIHIPHLTIDESTCAPYHFTIKQLYNDALWVRLSLEILLLKDAIMIRTKSDIDETRQAYGIQGIIQLKKEAFALELIDNSVNCLYD